MYELSENFSFDSDLALAFEIQSFKVACFAFFLNATVSKYSRAEWVNFDLCLRHIVCFVVFIT